jgi:hypothetical protein
MAKKTSKKASSKAAAAAEVVQPRKSSIALKPFNLAKAVAMAKDGKKLSEIAAAFFPKGKGNNYTHHQLVLAGARKERKGDK